jgi:hypothetical protein
MQSKEVAVLIKSGLDRVSDQSRRASLEKLLIEPRQLSLHWEYGLEGLRFNCWHVGQSLNGEIWLLYCEQGFGPSFPWGFVFPPSKSLGNDGQWYSGLEDATIGAGLLKAPAGYESPGPRE